MKPEQWIIEGEVGTSSRTIWAVMMGIVTEPQQCDWNYDTPSDPDDMSRCVKLIILFPEWRPRLNEVAQIFPKWTPYIREWNKLEKMYFQWVVNLDEYHNKLHEYFVNKPHTKRPRFHSEMYDFMQVLNREAMTLDGWIEDSPSAWHRPNQPEIGVTK